MSLLSRNCRLSPGRDACHFHERQVARRCSFQGVQIPHCSLNCKQLPVQAATRHNCDCLPIDFLHAQVNKYDFVDPISGTGKRDHTTSPRPPHATAVAGRLPAGTGSVVPWMTFWLKQCNDVVREQLSAASKWMFSPLDAAALMGRCVLLAGDCTRHARQKRSYAVRVGLNLNV